MTVPLEQLLASATRLAVLTTTHGASHAIADALTPLLERFVRMTTVKTILPIAIAFALVMTVRPALSQPGLVEPEVDVPYVAGGLTAAEAAARARASSPAVWRKAAELEAAAANLDAAKNLRVPALTAKLSYTRLSPVDSDVSPRGVGTAGIPQILDIYDAQAQLVVPLSDYFVRTPHLISAARLGRQSALLGARGSQADAAIGGIHAYYEWVRGRLQLSIANRQLAAVRANVQQVRSLVAVQRVARAELMRLESAEAEAEQTHDRLRELATLREEVLRLQIGARADELLSIGEDLGAELTAAPPASIDELVTSATRKRIDVRTLELGVEINEKRRLAERANAMPRLTAFAVTDYARPDTRSLPPTDSFAWSWSAGVQLTWSLPDALAARTTTRRLSAESAALRADRESVLRSARIEIISAQQGVQLARQAIETTRKGLIAAEETYRVRQALIAAQRATALELVDAQTNLTRARIAVLDAHIDMRIAMADLDHALGTDVSR